MKSDTKNHRSYGAAHGAAFGRSMMFGSRGPLLSPEDGNGAGATGGETTSTSTTTTTGTPGTAPAGAGGEKLLTQAQVNALVAQARREGRESAAQQTPPPQTTTQPKATTPPAGEAQPMTAEAVQQLMQRERAFTRATATAGLSEKQLARMEAAFNAEKPADVAAWSAGYLEDMGFAKPSTTQTTTQTTNGSTQTGQTPPAAAPMIPGASATGTAGGLTDIWNLSADQIEQLGPEGIRAEHEKILAHANKRSGAPPVPRVMQRK